MRERRNSSWTSYSSWGLESTHRNTTEEWMWSPQSLVIYGEGKIGLYDRDQNKGHGGEVNVFAGLFE